MGRFAIKLKVLITGASGYLGGRIAQNFAKRNQLEVRLTSRNHLNRFDSNDVDFRSIEWNSSTNLESICEGMDVIIHLAGMNAQESSENPVGSYEVNILNTARLLDASVKKGVKKFVYFSTAHVYANPLVGEFTEESVVKNFHPYAASHKAAEDILKFYASLGKIDAYILRLSNAYGPPISIDVNCWNLLVNDLCRQAVVQKKLVLKSNGMQKRDFVSIADVIQALDLFLSENKLSNSHKIFNLGGDWAISVLEMAILIQKRAEIILGLKPALERKEETQSGEVQDLFYNIEKIKTLGFRVTQNKTEEIDDLLQFCKENFQHNI
ncbi:NAD-dependent epimerase/dehydratase family protein [Leptospira borgpetersenii]|uniref:NAD-dependent epimerase/dehydratase family protein n=1 Tax=Leptospira borgpetersenii TaxID=174 RepID=UPI000773D5F7|nr:SDR family oxidoreductase [Leptospira borgpetersenii]